jgi:heptosyltransferase-2
MPLQRSPQQKILVIRAGALGDCLLMLPTLHALRAHFPQARIDVMGYPSRWEWVLGRGLVDGVYSIDHPGMHRLFGAGLSVPEHLRSFLGAYDIILSYRPDPHAVFERSLSALGARLVLSQPPFPPPPPPKIHVADFALQLVARLGVPGPPPAATGFSLNDAELTLTRPFFTSHQVDPARQPVVVVHPGSGSAAKRWPITNFASLIETLENQLGVRTVIVTGYAEIDLMSRLRPLLRRARPLVAENWPLLPTAALLAQAAVFVGHDSGLTHLAAALQRPTVAIFGPTDPEIWKPCGQRVSVVRMVPNHEANHEEPSSRHPSPPTSHDLRQVLDAVQHWLSGQAPRQSPNDRSAPA